MPDQDDDAEATRQLAWIRQTLDAYETIPKVLAELRALGVPYSRIRRETGLPLSTAHSWSHRHD